MKKLTPAAAPNLSAYAGISCRTASDSEAQPTRYRDACNITRREIKTASRPGPFPTPTSLGAGLGRTHFFRVQVAGKL